MNKKYGRLAYPYLLWMIVFTIVPLLLVAYFAFTAYDANGDLFFTLNGFKNIFSTDRQASLSIFGASSFFGHSIVLPIYVKSFVESLIFALLSTAICLVLGFPAAWILASLSINKKRGSALLLFLFVMPMWMNALLRTYAWLALLEPMGIVNNLLTSFNLPPLQLIYNDFGISLGLVYNYLPFMVLPIYSVLVKISPSLLEAASDLGANRGTTLRRVVMPMSVPGVLSGINMVLMPAMTTFLIPDLLGGGRYLLIGNAIERQYMVSRDYTTGSALSIVLLVFILISMQIVNRNVDPEEAQGGLI